MDRSSNAVLGSLSSLTIASTLQPLQNIKMALIFPPKDLPQGRNLIINFLRAITYIKQNQGMRGFFKGNISSISRAAVGGFFFFSILRHLESYINSTTNLTNFICSCSARMISTIFTNPISVVETRFQMTNFRGYSSIRDAIQKIIKNQGIMTFFKGLSSSCIKQGTFAGIHYMLYQKFKQTGMNKVSCGVLAGMLATSASHPFEIIRAKMQTEGIRQITIKTRLIQELKNMYVNGGWFRGLPPRLMKKPIGNTLALVLFEKLQNVRNNQI